MLILQEQIMKTVSLEGTLSEVDTSIQEYLARGYRHPRDGWPCRIKPGVYVATLKKKLNVLASDTINENDDPETMDTSL